MNKAINVLLGLVVCLAAACADELDAPSRITELRLLAVEADHPFAEAGQEVKLRALAIDPEQRALSWGWGTCIDAASTRAVDCLQTLQFDDLTIADDKTQHTLTMPETAAAYVGVVVVTCPGTLTRGETRGLPVSCVTASGQALDISAFEVGLKRLFVGAPALNENPRIGELAWDGVPWPEGEIKQSPCMRAMQQSCQEFAAHRIDVSAPGASESSVDSDDAPIEEQAVVQFYATGGEFDDDLRVYDKASTHWQAAREDAGQLLTFWFVVRDDRGGVSWISRQVQVL